MRRVGSYILLSGMIALIGVSAYAFAQNPRDVRRLPGAVGELPTTLDPGCESRRDDDGDGLDDGCEARLLNEHAPVLHLADNDWTMPASVDWYLARTRLRFHHNNCGDDQIADVGQVTQQNLLSFTHKVKKGLSGFCSHGSKVISTRAGPYDENEHFFLQPVNDNVHKGSSNPADWIVYGHAFPNASGGVNLQYWFFYPYNDNLGSFNHESDWESVMVSLNRDQSIGVVYFCAHGKCDHVFGRQSLTFHKSKHVEIWVADGSHASYPSEVSCDRQVFGTEGILPMNCSSQPERRWFTWAAGKGDQAGWQGGGVINVGERGRPLNGQHFIDYGGGTWGEQGNFEVTSGKRTPSFQANWNQGRAP